MPFDAEYMIQKPIEEFLRMKHLKPLLPDIPEHEILIEVQKNSSDEEILNLFNYEPEVPTFSVYTDTQGVN